MAELDLSFKITGDGRPAVAAVESVRSSVARSVSSMREQFAGLGQRVQAVGGQIQSAGQKITAAVTLPLAGLAAAAVTSASKLDALRNRLVAIEGDAGKAEARIKNLQNLARTSVGVTFGLAGDAYSQLSTIGDITERTIERQIKAVGRLNAAFTIEDQQGYLRNLTQIFQQNFERSDIKEAIGRVPIFEQLLESAFGTKDGNKLRALKESGKLTLDAYLSGLAEAVESDPRLAGIGESVGVRMQKALERVYLTLAPLGDVILKAVEPYIEPLTNLLERLSVSFEALPERVRLGVVAFGGIAAALGPAIIAIGALVSAIGAIASAVAAVSAPVALGLAAVVAAVVAAGAAFTAAYRENFGGFADYVGEVFAAVRGAVDSGLALVQDLWARHGADITATAQAVWTAVSGAVRTAATELVGLWRENLTIIVEWTRENWPLIRQTVETVVGALVSFVRNAVRDWAAFWAEYGETIKTVTAAVWGGVKLVVQTALQNLLGIVKAAMQIINGDWAGAWETVRGVLIRNVAALLSLAGRFLEAGAAIGRALVQGLLNAIKAGVSLTISAARELALAPVTAAKAALGIRSPSTVFYEIGTQIVRGLVNALRNGRGVVAEAMQALVMPPSLRGLKLSPQQQTRAAELAAEEARLAADRLRADAEREFSSGRASDAEHAKRLADAAASDKDAGLRVIAAQRQEAQATIKNRADLAIRLEELRLAERKLEAEHRERLRRIRDEAAERERRATEAHADALEKLTAFREQREIEALERMADEGVTTRFAAELRIQEIRDGALRREIEALESERSARSANLADWQRYTDEIALLQEKRVAAAEDAQRRVNASLATSGILGLGGMPKGPELPRGGPVVNFEEFQKEYGPPPDFSAHISAIQTFKDFAGQAFQGLTQGFAQMVGGWTSGAAAAKRSFGEIAKAVLSGVAVQAAGLAVFELAQGFAKLAMAFFGHPMAGPSAAMHFKAAGLFGIVAGITGAAAAALPSGGGSASAGASASGAFYDGGRENTRERDRTIREGRSGGAADPNLAREPQKIIIEVRSNDSHIVEAVKQNYRSFGAVYDIVSGTT